MRRLPVIFYILFFIDLFLKQKKSNTDIGLSENTFQNIDMKYEILIMPLNYFCLLITDSEFQPLPVFFYFNSPNYAQSSVFVQIKYIGSLAVWLPWAYFLCFSVSFSLLTFFLPNFAKYALRPMSECSCLALHSLSTFLVAKKVKFEDEGHFSTSPRIGPNDMGLPLQWSSKLSYNLDNCLPGKHVTHLTTYIWKVL